MNIKTETGVSIKIIPHGQSRILLFSKPVRLIELNEYEINQVIMHLSQKEENTPKKDSRRVSKDILLIKGR